MRVLITHGGRLFRFVNVEATSRDGSLIVTLRRDGKNAFRVSWDNRPGKETPVLEDFPAPREKNKKITIHQSGRINFPDLRDNPIFVEPLVFINTPISLYTYRIPRISALTEFAKCPDDDDVIFDLSALPDAAQSFEFILGPSDFVPPGAAVKIDYLRRCSLSIGLHEVPIAVPADYEDYFTTFARGAGLFPEQKIPEDAALIAYHQTLNDTHGVIIYSPNTKGEWRIVFAVPSRIAPRAVIELSNPDLCIEVIDQSLDQRTQCAQLRFVVREAKSRKIIHDIVSFRRVELSAEL